MSLIKLFAILLFPIAILKVVLAIMQGGYAWKNLGHLDIAEREQPQKSEWFFWVAKAVIDLLS